MSLILEFFLWEVSEMQGYFEAFSLIKTQYFYEINYEIYIIFLNIQGKSVVLGGAQIHTSHIPHECLNHLDHQHYLFPIALIQEPYARQQL